MNTQMQKPRFVLAWLSLTLGIGLAARFWFSTLGNNFDFASDRIIANLTAAGTNVYAGTDRYNYGPVWFNLIHILDFLAAHNTKVFRLLLVGLLSAADVGIFFVLWRKFGRLAATLLFLNPVSVMITGFHNQFDNIAILIGMCAMLVFGNDFEKPLDRRKFVGLALLGLSLMTKHLFFVFPFWLAVKQRGLTQKILVLSVPIVVFFIGFLPYASAYTDIIRNVFEYRSASGFSGFFYNQMVPEFFRGFAGAGFYWLFVLTVLAFICRAKNSLDSLLLYTGALVAVSPAMTNQYLAIPVPLVSVVFNFFSIGYTVAATVHIAEFANGPHLIDNPGGRCDDIAVVFLIALLIWQLWREPLLRALKHCRREINRQFENG
jgi:hypothetical protein